MSETSYRLACLIKKWANCKEIQFQHGETLRVVSLDDLDALVAAVESDTRERIASMIEGKPFKDGDNAARRGPCGIGTWHESSPMGQTMRDLARCIRQGFD
jgi:hypothetical protein